MEEQKENKKAYSPIEIFKYSLLLSIFSFSLGFYTAIKNRKPDELRAEQARIRAEKKKLALENEFALMNIAVVCPDLDDCSEFLEKIKKNDALKGILQLFHKKEIRILPGNSYGYIFYLDVYKIPISKVICVKMDDDPQLMLMHLEKLLPKNTPE